ncbi:hypothetical protein [Sinorhizobium sp. NFACC03]|uniref:hypothetical protein n=1 Tax=Sinorhizobium sp. NFACC03 TaxID=1566295 RepID=UPI000882F244|nr:hypothetical protein [Sinorhizobium sp. NFACC03]SDA47954.1 hypothetical protein SAMN03159448_00907 [Sinorhizobium sp. NFACC03]
MLGNCSLAGIGYTKDIIAAAQFIPGPNGHEAIGDELHADGVVLKNERCCAQQRGTMSNSSKRPPVFVRWLSLKQRLIIAEKLRGIGSSLAEWICPEIAEGSDQ